jgi:hypothetical protein
MMAAVTVVLRTKYGISSTRQFKDAYNIAVDAASEVVKICAWHEATFVFWSRLVSVTV